MSKVAITKELLDNLADAVSAKTGESVPLTIDDMTDAIEAITLRTGTDLSASGATVTVPAGLYSAQATKNVASGSATTPATTITANPSISVDASGLITATASASQSVTPTVSEGYVSSGTAGTITVSGSNTSQLTTQAAQTIHPSTSDQTIASGKYLTGTQTIKGVALSNLTAGNIKKDVVVKVGDSTDDDCVTSITGTYEGSGGDNVLVVTISWDDDYFDEGEGAWIPDKTFAEISAAYSAGKNVVCTISVAGEPFDYYLASCEYDDEADEFYYAVIDTSGISALSTTYLMTSNGIDEDAGFVWFNTENATISSNSQLLNGIKAVGSDGTVYTGNIPTKTSSDLTASGSTVTAPAGYYASNATYTMPTADPYVALASPLFYTENNQRKWRIAAAAEVNVGLGDTEGWLPNGFAKDANPYTCNAIPTGTTVTPSTSTQTVGGANYMMEGAVTVAAMPSGTAGTPTATKGAVSNHSVSVTPSVTNTTGYITGSTKTGTAVTVSASELVSGSQTITENGTVDVTNLASVVVSVEGGGGSGMTVATATTTLNSANASISFTGLSGEPTSFSVLSAADLATGASPYKTAAVVFDGTDLHGQIVTNTNNAQASYSASFTKSYSNGTLTITGTGTNFQANQYKLVYTYGGNSANLGTDDVQVGSGATSIAFTGLSDEPDYFSIIFKSDFSTSSGYQRVMAVTYDGNSTYGMAMDSGGKALSSWSYTYNNGTLTVSSTGTNNGGYFHQPGYYQLTYGIGGTVEPVEIEVEPLSVTENGTYTAPTGKAYSPVTVNVSGGGSATVATKTTTLSAIGQTLTFTQLSGTPKMWAVRCTTQVSSSGSTTYYYLMDAVYDGTSVKGNCFRIGSTRRIQNVTSGLSQSYSGGTLTITGGSSSGATPGQWYNGEYELVYVY